MQERFLSGLDADQFDYDAIDRDQDFDDLRVQEIEDQEKYFDQIEEAESAMRIAQAENILDY